MSYGFVYLWYDRKHKRYYIGSHWGTEYDGYVCSSTWMMQAYKIRANDFKRRILQRVYTNRQDLLQAEFNWISLIKEEEIKKRYYNLNIKATGHWSAYPENVKTIKEKISHRTKEAIVKPENRELYLEGLKKRNTRSSDPEVRTKRSESMKKTMAEKFPEENRWKKLSPEDRKEYYSNKAKTNWAKEGFKESVSRKISESLKASKEVRSKHMSSLRWWNNGLINTRKPECPGEDWVLGKLK